MSTVFIIGATGGVGSRLGPMLIKAGHQVTGLHRSPDQAGQLSAAGMTPCLGDIIDMTVEDLTSATKNSDVIVFTAGAAGSGQDRTSAIDGEGVVKTIEAAQANAKAATRANGIARLYLVSAFMDANRGKPTSEGFEHYMRVKRHADAALVASGLQWVILRPGALISEDGNGLVNANLAIPQGPVARGNVAAMLAQLIEAPEVCREIIELTDGEVPVSDAVMSLRR